MKLRPAFVISIDFELMWGVRDHKEKSAYGQNILQGRQAIPKILELFEKYKIRATWATVGLVFCENKEEMISISPTIRPTYHNKHLSNYSYFDEVGENEKKDPYYFGASLVSLISSLSGQEVGSHTFSHYYCLEPGQTIEQFDADIEAAIAIARLRNITLKSFVFPRNQFSVAHLATLRRHDVNVFRGNELAWPYQASTGAQQSPLRRISRLADQYINLFGHHTTTPVIAHGATNIAASRFLRPYSRRLAPLDNIRLQRITASMKEAASKHQVFHLWWHPHNFGTSINENIAILDHILNQYSKLHSQYGMISANMGDFA